MSLSIVDQIYLAIFIIIILPLFYVEYYERRYTRISPTSTLPWVRKKVLELLAEELKDKRDVKIAELGAGWGDLSFAVHKKFSFKATITSYELSPYPYLICRLKKLLNRRNVAFTRKDFFKEDLSSYDILVAYLAPWIMKDLQAKIEREEMKNFTLVTMSFRLGDLKPHETHIVDFKIDKIPIYIYRF